LIRTWPLPSELERQFGQIDIYLFDQLLRGRIRAGMRVLDAACGGGRNLVYLLRTGFEVFGTDANPDAVAAVRRLAAQLAPQLPADNFRVEPVERMSFADGFADVVLSSAVLHFAHDQEQFHAMVREMWRVLTPGGMLFCRLASSIGMEDRVRPVGSGRFLLPDGSERFLANEAMLMDLTSRLGGRLLDPLKTTVVQNQRCMTTWVIRKD
jgi:tellurite methyltransferase